MNNRKPTDYFICDGSVSKSGSILIAAGLNADSTQTNSRVEFRIDNKWTGFNLKNESAISSTTILDIGYVAGSNGSIYEIPLFENQDLSLLPDKIIGWSITDIEKFGEITRIRNVNGKAFCCGQGGQVYCLQDSAWNPIGAELRKRRGPSFEDIAGDGTDNLYAVGMNGSIYHFNGSLWTKIDAPTNKNLSNIIKISEDTYVICGDHGLVIKGNGDKWELISEPSIDKNFWGLELFKGNLYLSHGNGIDKINTDGTKEPVEIVSDEKLTFHRLFSSNSDLYSFGTDDLVKFDSKNWERIDLRPKKQL